MQQEFPGSLRMSRVRSALAYPGPEKDGLSDQRQLDRAAGVHAARPLETYSGEAEMIGKILVSTGGVFATRQILGLKIHTVGRKDELRLRFGSRGALFQRL